MFNDLKINLPIDIREKIQFWVDKADKEVSGLGDAWLDLENKTIDITSAFMLDQECTAADTELDGDAVSRAMFEAHQDEVKGIRRNIKFWWHSHVNMDVFWSGTDTTTMAELSEHGWFCHIVFNKKREMRAAFSYPVTREALGVKTNKVEYQDNIKVNVSNYFTAVEQAALEEEFKTKYKEKFAYSSNGFKDWTYGGIGEYVVGEILPGGDEVVATNGYLTICLGKDGSLTANRSYDNIWRDLATMIPQISNYTLREYSLETLYLIQDYIILMGVNDRQIDRVGEIILEKTMEGSNDRESEQSLLPN